MKIAQGKVTNATLRIFEPLIPSRVTFFRLVNTSASDVAVTVTIKARDASTANLIPPTFNLIAYGTLDIVDFGDAFDLDAGESICALAGTTNVIDYRICASDLTA